MFSAPLLAACANCQHKSRHFHTKHSDNPSANPFGSSCDNSHFVVVAQGHFVCGYDDKCDAKRRCCQTAD